MTLTTTNLSSQTIGLDVGDRPSVAIILSPLALLVGIEMLSLLASG